MKHILRNLKRILTTLITALFIFAPPHALSQNKSSEKTYNPQERQTEEARIRKKIEERLDWKNRTPETLDDVADADRMLIGVLNESILLKQSTRERFGLFEAIDDTTNTKVIEIRLHKKNKITDRFPIYSSVLCDRAVDIKANKVASSFVVYTTTCYSTKYGTNSMPFLFDYASRNLYRLAEFDYDAVKDEAPDIKLENGIYKMRWSVRPIGGKKKTSVVRNFKITKSSQGEWTVKELPPIGVEEASINAMEKLPANPAYDLPAFVADWGEYWGK